MTAFSHQLIEFKVATFHSDLQMLGYHFKFGLDSSLEAFISSCHPHKWAFAFRGSRDSSKAKLMFWLWLCVSTSGYLLRCFHDAQLQAMLRCGFVLVRNMEHVSLKMQGAKRANGSWITEQPKACLSLSVLSHVPFWGFLRISSQIHWQKEADKCNMQAEF